MIKRILIFVIFWNISYNANINNNRFRNLIEDENHPHIQITNIFINHLNNQERNDFKEYSKYKVMENICKPSLIFIPSEFIFTIMSKWIKNQGNKYKQKKTIFLSTFNIIEKQKTQSYLEGIEMGFGIKSIENDIFN